MAERDSRRMTPAKKARGRPALPPDETQTAMIRERITPAQRAEYEALGGKAWLVKALARKLRKAPKAV